MRVAERPLETEAVRHWETILTPHFDIEHEVTGRSPHGKRYRIDMLLHPTFNWPSGGRHPIGFEIKRPHPSVAEFTKAVGQAVDYAQAQWHTTRSPAAIRIYVAVFDPYTSDQRPSERFFLDRLAGRLNVAFIRPHPQRVIDLRTSGERRWSLNGGPSHAAFSAIPKDGSR